jgi:hypothetical protein
MRRHDEGSREQQKDRALNQSDTWYIEVATMAHTRQTYAKETKAGK